MQKASLVLGLVSVILSLIGFVPCLGSLNWLSIPIAGVGLLISIIAFVQKDKDENINKLIAGLILCIFTIIFGTMRLIMGGGIL